MNVTQTNYFNKLQVYNTENIYEKLKWMGYFFTALL